MESLLMAINSVGTKVHAQVQVPFLLLRPC
ncbi:rCG53138 [Rattus norvegicus]|uniref:RCG53138 n=1 Tax=Rattus norvegicus TaxID=10116 RepID=A6JMN6_RAT|nr:rCG53138 [Rattus norvegicus]